MPEAIRGISGMRGFAADLWRMVFVRPVRYGTLDLSTHSRGVAGIAVGVAALYALTVASILLANPLRSVSSLKVSLSSDGLVAVPGLLVPAVLCLLGVAFGLLLAGSQRSPWWRRVLYLIVVWGALVSVAGFAVALGSSRPLGIASSALTVVVLLYCLAMWTGRTVPEWDTAVLVVLASGILLAGYRSVILQTLIGTESGELITVSFILTQVASLALPIAFLSGVNAAEFGVSLVAWGGADIGRRAVGRLVGPLVVIVVLGWQWQALVREAIDDFGSVSELVKQGLGAVILLILCLAVWRFTHRGAGERVSSPVDVGAGSVTVALPVAYAITAPAFIAALLGALVASVGTLVSRQIVDPLTTLLDIVGSDAFMTATRVLVIAGLAVGAALLVRRGSVLLGAIAGVDAVVLATYFWVPSAISDWMWTPPSIGNVGLVVATVLAVAWTIRRTWDGARMSFLLVLALLSALVRQADFFALPVGFLIGASAVAVLVIGLVWGFLTDGGGAHQDTPGFPRDRRLLTVLGEFLFATTVVAWAVIGKDVGMAATLSSASAQAVLTLGSALIISVLLASASPWMRVRRPEGAREDAVDSHGGQG
jgi:hypothetical protein